MSYFQNLAIVNIKLVDVNDNYPIIYDAKLIESKDGPIYELNAHIEENCVYGTEIAKIRAFDLDIDRNLTFIVSNLTRNEFISVDKQTGNLQ